MGRESKVKGSGKDWEERREGKLWSGCKANKTMNFSKILEWRVQKKVFH